MTDREQLLTDIFGWNAQYLGQDARLSMDDITSLCDTLLMNGWQRIKGEGSRPCRADNTACSEQSGNAPSPEDLPACKNCGGLTAHWKDDCQPSPEMVPIGQVPFHRVSVVHGDTLFFRAPVHVPKGAASIWSTISTTTRLRLSESCCQNWIALNLDRA